MKKAESRGRVFYIGIIAAVFIALAGLGACNTGIGPDGPGEQATPIGAVDAQGRVEVRVALPASSGGDARSVTNAYVPVYVDYYEVIFRKHDTSEYLFASAEVGKAYLSMSLLPGEKFDILLLAGVKASRVLLATAFVDNDDGVTGAGNGNGFTVQAGQANVIHPTMKYTNLTPDPTADISFLVQTTAPASEISSSYARDSLTNIARLKVTTSTAPGTLTVKLSTAKLAELAKAQFGNTLTLAPNTGILKSRYPLESGKFGPPMTAAVVAAGDPYTYTFNIEQLKVDGNLLNIDGRLRLEMRYYGFGTPDSGSSGWNIRNGLDFDEDNGGSGGELVVQFGTGSVIPEPVNVEMNL